MIPNAHVDLANEINTSVQRYDRERFLRAVEKCGYTMTPSGKVERRKGVVRRMIENALRKLGRRSKSDG